MAKIRKRLSIEQKFDVNPAYCDNFLRQTLWGFITGYMIAGGTSKADAVRCYMDYFGVDDDIATVGETYRVVNAKMKTLINNKRHIELVQGLMRVENEK